MPATRPTKHSRSLTLHLLVPSPTPSSTTSASPTASSASASHPRRPSARVLALAREMAASRGQLLLDPSGPWGTGEGSKRPGGYVGELSEGKSMKGCREWNGLLCWARKGRGARWDASSTYRRFLCLECAGRRYVCDARAKGEGGNKERAGQEGELTRIADPCLPSLGLWHQQLRCITSTIYPPNTTSPLSSFLFRSSRRMSKTVRRGSRRSPPRRSHP